MFKPRNIENIVIILYHKTSLIWIEYRRASLNKYRSYLHTHYVIANLICSDIGVSGSENTSY